MKSDDSDRSIVRIVGVSKRFGAIATHMPKPFARLTGSGCHFHISLWDPAGSRNLFLDEADRRGLGLSELAYRFLGGVMSHARALTAVVAPTVIASAVSAGELVHASVHRLPHATVPKTPGSGPPQTTR